jgi:hypothetical protein
LIVVGEIALRECYFSGPIGGGNDGTCGTLSVCGTYASALWYADDLANRALHGFVQCVPLHFGRACLAYHYTLNLHCDQQDFHNKKHSCDFERTLQRQSSCCQAVERKIQTSAFFGLFACGLMELSPQAETR